ncbi:MAG: sulfotransferase [Smithella sp.]
MEYDPHEPGKRVLKYLKITDDEDFFLKLNAALQNADLSNSEREIDVSDLPIIYIVGAPRSGTTLLSQLISRYLPVGYINNMIARFWMRPSVGIRLSEVLLGGDARREITFQSSFGTTRKIQEPHEFGYFWRHWLSLDQSPTHKLSPDLLTSLDKKGLKVALEKEILTSFQRPVVFKNVICGLQAAFLTEIHPLSLFIHISRDPFITAASILKSRQARFGSYDTWWSLKPSTWPFSQYGKDASSEVAMQVYECRREIDEELSKPNVQVLQMTYEDLCGQTLHSLERICGALERLGQEIRPLGNDISPLHPSKKTDLPDNMIDQLNKSINKIFHKENL